jgi:hypothetical protein
MKLWRSTGSVASGAAGHPVNVGKGMVCFGRAPVVKLTVAPFVIVPPVFVSAYMVYAVLGYIPATSNVMVEGGGSSPNS